MDHLREVVQNSKFQEDLLFLYRHSSSECRDVRGGTPDVGRSRELDLITALKYHNVEIADCPMGYKGKADCMINGRPVSIKHYANHGTNQAFKMSWTSDKDKAHKEMERIVFEGVSDDMLIVKLNKKTNEVTVFYMDYDKLNKLMIESARYKPFDPLDKYLDPYRIFKKKASVNDRGTEFTCQFKNIFYANCNWVETFSGEFTSDRQLAYERRLSMLRERN